MHNGDLAHYGVLLFRSKLDVIFRFHFFTFKKNYNSVLNDGKIVQLSVESRIPSNDDSSKSKHSFAALLELRQKRLNKKETRIDVRNVSNVSDDSNRETQ